eukprot:m.426832 g.426832  ORF g.426832 m.426832 type:complete len:281 (-) comp16863_c0_seq14:7-849(-)
MQTAPVQSTPLRIVSAGPTVHATMAPVGSVGLTAVILFLILRFSVAMSRTINEIAVARARQLLGQLTEASSPMSTWLSSTSTRKVFISFHCESGTDTARAVSTLCRRLGWQTFCSPSDHASTSEIEARVNEACLFLFVLSPEYFNCKECCAKIRAARAAGTVIVQIYDSGKYLYSLGTYLYLMNASGVNNCDKLSSSVGPGMVSQARPTKSCVMLLISPTTLYGASTMLTPQLKVFFVESTITMPFELCQRTLAHGKPGTHAVRQSQQSEHTFAHSHMFY